VRYIIITAFSDNNLISVTGAEFFRVYNSNLLKLKKYLSLRTHNIKYVCGVMGVMGGMRVLGVMKVLAKSVH